MTVISEKLEEMLAQREATIAEGEPHGFDGEIKIDPVWMLKRVVAAVIAHDQGHILHEFPELLAVLGSRLPTPEEIGHETEMMRAAKGWCWHGCPNRKDRA